MSSKDKTREKLMGSMRKTKADAGIGSNEQAKPAASTTAATPPAAKPAARSSTPANRPPQPRTTGSADSYQSGRRVWPD